jgi:hypothetical protein
MRVVLVGVYYKGEPVYREWSTDRKEINFFSRETKQLGNGKGWKFVRWVPLYKVRVDRRLSNIKRQAKVIDGHRRLLLIKGITEAA